MVFYAQVYQQSFYIINEMNFIAARLFVTKRLINIEILHIVQPTHICHCIL